MATNLVSLVMQFLTPDTINRIALALGVDRSNVQSAVGAAVPALLAGLSSVAAQPGGPQKLAAAASREAGTLERFAGMLGADGQIAVADRGTEVLTSLLGGRDQDALANAVGRFAGVSPSAGNALLGMLAPVVMGAIAKEQGSRSLDAENIADLLADQKDNIAATLPSGFGSLLGGTTVLDALGGAARTATAAGGETARTAAYAARAVSDTGGRAASAALPSAASFKWLYWLIAALAIGVLLYTFFAKPTEVAVQKATTAAQSLLVGGVDVGKQVSDGIGSLRTTLAGVTDAASAQAALPKLREAAERLDKVSAVTGQLSAEQRRTLSGLVNPLLPTINQLFDKVLAIPGAAAVLKPAIDALRAKLAVLAA